MRMGAFFGPSSTRWEEAGRSLLEGCRGAAARSFSLLLIGASVAQVVPPADYDPSSTSEVVTLSFSFLKMVSAVTSRRGSTNIFVVLVAPDSEAVTYLIDWSTIAPLGPGDQHVPVAYLDPYARRIPLGDGGGAWYALLYPTKELRER